MIAFHEPKGGRRKMNSGQVSITNPEFALDVRKTKEKIVFVKHFAEKRCSC